PDNTDWTWTTPEKGDGLILAPDKEGLVRLVTAARVVRSHQTPDGLTSLYLITEDNRFRLTYTGLAEVTIEAGAELACGEAVGSTRPSGMRFSVHKIADASVWWEGEPVETLTFLAKSDKSQ
ncbi:MAG: hypothetical protein QNK37_23335, partial [Acidobacteriota bacterium]|nr:hypothetical protein [Acidobacteriota bacterium]